LDISSKGLDDSSNNFIISSKDLNNSSKDFLVLLGFYWNRTSAIMLNINVI